MMSKHKLILPALTVALLLLMAVSYHSLTWKIGDGYAIKFSTHKAEGAFTDLRGEIKFDENNLEKSSFDVTVAASSIETGIGLKDKHARGEHWFEVDRYPEIRFKSSNITRTTTGYETTGTLDLHGVKKEINIPFTFENQTFKGQFELNRLDYKLGAETGLNGAVGKILTITLHVPVTQ